MAETLYLGIDGGGSKCRVRLCDAAGRSVGEGFGGPANARLEPAAVMAAILTAAGEATKAAGLDANALKGAHAGFGLAGANLPGAAARLVREPHPFASVAIETDAYAAWLGAHGGDDGAILILGTGSCGLAVVRGRQTYVSGWGAEVSDEASGMWIGREAIRRTLWAYDGRAAMTPLAEAIFVRLGGSPAHIVAFVTGARPADYARLAPLVLEHAGRDEPLAVALVSAAAADAARIVDRLLDAGVQNVCLLGGLAGPLTPWLPASLQKHFAAPRGDAMDGAILMARRAEAGATSKAARA